MTFEKVQEAMGQIDPRSNYAVKVVLKCTLDTAEPVRIDRNTRKRTQQVLMTDNQGKQNKVKIVGNNPDLTPFAGQILDFEISAYVADYDGLTYYSGFCNVPQQQQAPQGPQQAQQPPQQRQGAQQRQVQQRRPQQAQPAPRDYDKEARGKCRFGLYQALLQRGRDAEDLNRDIPMLQAVEGLIEKAMNGLPAPQQTFKQAMNEEPPDEQPKDPDNPADPELDGQIPF